MKIFQWTIIASFMTRITSSHSPEQYRNLNFDKEMIPEVCDDVSDLDWNDINEKAFEKLKEIKQFMERKDVKENVEKEIMVSSHNRIRRHDYYDNDDDHNIVVRCKHGYTGIK